MSEEFFGGLKILANVSDNKVLMHEAAKTLVLFGAISSEHKMPDLTAIPEEDELLEDASPSKKIKPE